MNTLSERLALIKRGKRLGIMTHVVAGYPTIAESERIILAMERTGVDFIELQIPFSDPIADGPVIMEANDRALQKGTRVADCFRLAARVSRKISAPLLCMTYYNIIHHVGVSRFCERAHRAGLCALIVPDMPVDEESHEGLLAACRKHGLFFIPVLSPTSTDARMKMNAVSQGLVYCTARAGTTGVRATLPAGLLVYLSRVRRAIRVPIAVGFGISDPSHLRALKGKVDIAVVGSALLSRYDAKGVPGVRVFLRRMLAAR